VGRIGVDGSLGGIANLVVISVSIPVVLGLLLLIWRRNAAVGRSEFVMLFSVSPREEEKRRRRLFLGGKKNRDGKRGVGCFIF